MLSEKNREKICMTGLYRCKPDKSLMGYEDGYEYWCKNWTFKPMKFGDSIKMVDTYFNDKLIELTDDNFDKFEFVFDFKEVDSFTNREYLDRYNTDDWFCIATDSGGRSFPNYYLKKNAYPLKEKVVEKLEYEISVAKNNLESLKRRLEKVNNDEVDLRYA